MGEKATETGEHPPERALVVRLWPAAPLAGTPQWRIVVQDVATQERRGFAALDDFFLFMEQLCSTPRRM